ncbi:hypothetical protein BV378_13585, partial [Nostoc sp. RF31YmG]
MGVASTIALLTLPASALSNSKSSTITISEALKTGRLFAQSGTETQGGQDLNNTGTQGGQDL